VQYGNEKSACVSGVAMAVRLGVRPAAASPRDSSSEWEQSRRTLPPAFSQLINVLS
jgi:hypothetical protein